MSGFTDAEIAASEIRELLRENAGLMARLHAAESNEALKSFCFAYNGSLGTADERLAKARRAYETTVAALLAGENNPA